MARLARRLRRSKTIDGGKTSETTGFREVDGALCRAGAGRAVAAPGLSTIGSVQRVGVGAPTPDPALLRNATFSPQAHGCPEKMSRVNQSVAAHAPQNKGTR